MSPPGTPRPALDHLPELDGIRGVAILLILIWHYFVSQAAVVPGSTAWWMARASVLSWSGVDLFFAISGFLLGSILISHRGGRGNYRAFYARRACRILPLYALLLALYVLADAWITDPANPGHAWLFGRPMPFWTYATFTQNFVMAFANTSGAHFLGITWSLAVEEQFYLVLPLFIALVPRRMLPWLLAALICLAPVLRAVAFAQRLDAVLLMPTRMDSLLGGVLLACLLQEPAIRAWLHSRVRYLKLLLGVFFLAFVVLTIDRRALGVLDHTWLAGFYCLLIAVAIMDRDGSIARWMRTRWLIGLGLLSYSVYLFHQAVSGLLYAAVFHRQPDIDSAKSAAVTLAALGISIAIALATRKFIEAPLISLGRRIAYGKPAPSGS